MYTGDMVELLEGLASAAVGAFPALSLSVAYLNASSVSTLHHAGALVDTPTDASIYDVGPISNTFTGTVLAHAVAAQRLSLSTSVKDLLPELEGTAFPEEITLLSLATHTSGLPNDPPGYYDTPFHKYEGLTEKALLHFLDTYATIPPPSGPDAYSYSYLGAGSLAYVLERALETSWEQLLHDVITGPHALDMPDTACMLTPEQQSRNVQGYIHEWDYSMLFTPEQAKEWNLKKAGNFYAAPLWDWAGNPLKGAGCLRSSLPDMVKYVRAAIGGAAALKQECRANYKYPLPDPSRCLPEQSDIYHQMGYAQQRQAVQGERFTTQEMELLAVEGWSDMSSTAYLSRITSNSLKAAPDAVNFPKLQELFEPILSSAGLLPETPKKRPQIDDIGEGVGLLWMTEDWSDTPHMPSGVKYHDGFTMSSSSCVLVNPDLQLGVVVLANFPGTGSMAMEYSPFMIAYNPWTEWWCGAAGADCSEG